MIEHITVVFNHWLAHCFLYERKLSGLNEENFSLKKTFLSLKFLYERKFEWIELFILVLRQFKAHNFRCSKLPCDGVNLASARAMLGQSTKIPVKNDLHFCVLLQVFGRRFGVV